jgi:hypothetical protein
VRSRQRKLKERVVLHKELSNDENAKGEKS